jgi:hypothetical protein
VGPDCINLRHAFIMTSSWPVLAAMTATMRLCNYMRGHPGQTLIDSRRMLDLMHRLAGGHAGMRLKRLSDVPPPLTGIGTIDRPFEETYRMFGIARDFTTCRDTTRRCQTRCAGSAAVVAIDQTA